MDPNGIQSPKAYMGYPWVIIYEHRAFVCTYIYEFSLNKQTNKQTNKQIDYFAFLLIYMIYKNCIVFPKWNVISYLREKINDVMFEFFGVNYIFTKVIYQYFICFYLLNDN